MKKWITLEPVEDLRYIKFLSGDAVTLEEVTHLQKGETTIRLKHGKGIFIFNPDRVAYIDIRVADLTV